MSSFGQEIKIRHVIFLRMQATLGCIRKALAVSQLLTIQRSKRAVRRIQHESEGDESSLDGALEAWSEQSNVFYQMGLVPIAYDEHVVFLLSPLR